MRIIGGAVGGRRIRAPHGTSTRPTSDKVRGALFNILGRPEDNARVLDLYAGAGALGLEALSRGAVHATFVDRDSDAVRCVVENAGTLGLENRVRVQRGEATTVLSRLAKGGERFTWVFIDPPYASGESMKALLLLGKHADTLLDDDAVVVVEHDRRHAPEDAYGALERADRRRYGDTEISFFRRAGRPGAAETVDRTTADAAAERSESPADEPAQPEESPDDDA
jgi:16S rRNA (guanine(966)-N(2))-methyltransferase RsmD